MRTKPARPSNEPPHEVVADDALGAPEIGLKPRLLMRQSPAEAFAPGGFPPQDEEIETDEEVAPKYRGWRRLLHPFVLLVCLPTLVATAFEYGIAADQYESSAQFIVRTPQPASPANGLGQMLGLAQGPVTADAHSVDAYLLSHDAVRALGSQRLTDIFRRPEADVASRLWDAAPAPETLHKFYGTMVHLTTATETGISSLSVRAFRPDDAKRLADDLLRLGEARVNKLNRRMFDDGLAASARQLREAEAGINQIQAKLTGFRQAARDADPEKSSTAQIQLAASLQEQAARARAQFQAMAAGLPPTAPQYRLMSRQVASLDGQVAAAKARLAGSARSVAAGLGNYEELQMRQQLAAKRFEAAQASYQSAREQLLKQQLFIVPVVEPNMPVKALFPKRLTIIATVFFGLLFAYAIGWLILSGLREHAD
ncbi:capsule biosynthesis protein [Sphingomonas sp. dw_22]|uniref:capsule biosynthesis protein n=1 Tax=Sphingomonas sp. dw_22 TaxID=2721175 RepID=UPI002115CE73|nr:capsule biosynthesis protein [Sphingomonas sp. dw_22]